MKRAGIAFGLIGLAVVVVAFRSIGFEHVFPGDHDGVVLAMDDAQYHARRAAYTFENFPEVLAFDRYLNFPRGAFVPWPPLYDFALGATARLFGEDRASLDRVLAWAPVALGLFTALAVFVTGRALGGLGVAFGAMALFAGLPATTHYSSVGNPDHHAAVTFVATLLLLGHVKSAQAGESPFAVWAWQGVLVIVRIAMMLTWHGSILYVVLAESLAVAAAALAGRRELRLASAAGCGMAAIVGFWLLSFPHSEVGGPWSAVEFSRLQPAAYAGFALISASSMAADLVLAGRGVSLGASTRLAVTAAAGVALLALGAFFAWDGLRLAWEYASRAEPYIAENYESHPLWSAPANAFRLYAGTLVLVPLAPIGGLLAARREELRPQALILAGWTAVLVCIAASNARYASDFAPAACFSFALLGAAVVGRFPVARVVMWIAIPLLLLPSILDLAPHARRSLAILQGHEVVLERPGEGLVRSVYSFMEVVRSVTPDPGGFLDPKTKPDYGIIVPPTLGFVTKGLGERPTLAGNFGPYVGTQGLEASRTFYMATDEKSALVAAMPTFARYVVTTDEGRKLPNTMRHRLHHDDGSLVEGHDAIRHLRLVAESPRKGVPLGALRGAAPNFVDKPYKLFEIVPGAVMIIAGSAAGGSVFVEVEIDTGAGRRFTYQATATASKQGFARVRVPYATDATTPARPLGPYTVRTDSGVQQVEILESQIAGQEDVFIR